MAAVYRAMTAFSVLMSKGLASPTVLLYGARRGWARPADVAQWALHALQFDESFDSYTLVQLMDAGKLFHQDVFDLLSSLISIPHAVDDPRVVHCWMLASLVSLRGEAMDEESRLGRLDELYADFHYAEELRYISYLNFHSSESSGDSDSDRPFFSPIVAADEVARALNLDLTGRPWSDEWQPISHEVKARKSNVVMDGRYLRSESQLHEFLEKSLDLGPFYGRNWHALRDCLLGNVPRPIHFQWINARDSRAGLSNDWFYLYVELFVEAQRQDEDHGFVEKLTFALEE